MRSATTPRVIDPRVAGRALARAACALVAALAIATPTVGAAPPARYVASAELLGHVFDLADARLALMPDIACAKRLAHLPLVDARRESEVAAGFERAATAAGLAPGSTAATIRTQIALARAAQARAAVSRTTPCPSLADSRARLDRWTPRFAAALLLAGDALHDAALADRIARERLPSSRWSEADRAALVAALAGVERGASPSLARARSVGVLRVGTPGDYAPFATERDGVLSGADVELALQLAAALGLEPVFVRTSWRTLVDDLRADRFDLAVGGVSVTAERALVGTFATPHAHGGKTAIGRCADRDRLRSLRAIDRAGVRLVVNPGGTNERFVRQHVRRANVRVHADNRTIFDEIVAGRADAMITDDTEVTLQTRRHPELCRLVPQTWSRAAKAIYLQPDPQLRHAVDAWLAGELAAGAPQRLLEAAIAAAI